MRSDAAIGGPSTRSLDSFTRVAALPSEQLADLQAALVSGAATNAALYAIAQQTG